MKRKTRNKVVLTVLLLGAAAVLIGGTLALVLTAGTWEGKLKGAQEKIGSLLKEGLATIAAVPVHEVEEKAETAQEKVKNKGAELKEHLSERLETLRERISEEVETVKERVTEGLQSAVKEGKTGDTFGRPPTGRPPSLRPPSGHPPTGRPPSARPPSGRPPSLERRHA